MKKAFFVFALLVIGMMAGAQVSGKYVTDKFIEKPDTIAVTTDQTFPIEVGGENYIWNITAKWASSGKRTTTVSRIQVSPDGSTWMNYGAADSVKSSTGVYYTGTDCSFKWIRLFVDVTTGDSIKGLNVWYTFKRK